MWPPSPSGLPKGQKFVLWAHKSPLRCFWLQLSHCPVAGTLGMLVVSRIRPGVSRSFELGEMVQAVLSVVLLAWREGLLLPISGMQVATG